MRIFTADEPEVRFQVLAHKPANFSGNEHSQNFAYYASDDEYVGDAEGPLDEIALRDWRDQEED